MTFRLNRYESFEEAFMRYIRAEKQDLKKEIMEKKALDDDLKAKLTEAITAFKKTFSA